MVPRKDDVPMIWSAEMAVQASTESAQTDDAGATSGAMHSPTEPSCSPHEASENGQCDLRGEGHSADADTTQPAPEASDEHQPEEVEEDQIIKLVAKILAQAGAYSILNPGCGHGHCARFLARSGFTVTAFDLPSRTVHLAQAHEDEATASLRYHVDDPGLPKRNLGLFDGLFAHSLLHSMTRNSRHRVLRLLSNYVRPGGVALFSVLSERDPRYGLGREIEPGTFEILPGQVLHFYTDDELAYELEAYFRISFMELVTEVEIDHQGNRREYAMILIGGVKKII